MSEIKGTVSVINGRTITVAETAGFCYGVKRAVDGVYEAIDKGVSAAMYGDVIHNTHVISDLESKGVISCNEIGKIPADRTVIIRAHGVGKKVYDELAGRKYIDLTCPFVAKIHKIVGEYYEKGYKIVIAGDKNHPEVIGINGWCNDEAIIINGENEINEVDFGEKPLCIVAQTTINKKIFVDIVQNVKKTCKSTLIFDTICSATKERQEEAAGIAAGSDCMIVIGDKKSSNTRRLFEISANLCKFTCQAETCDDIPPRAYNKTYKKIGITAGASTPGCIIEEVVKAMSENMQKEENFAELFEQYSSRTLNNGDIVDGTVVEVRNNEVIVDLGGFKYNGQLAVDQLTDDPSLKPSDVVKVGDTIKVYVVGVNDAEGKVVLSRKKLVAMESWNKIKTAYETQETLSGKIIKTVKGGLIALTEGTQVFIPARQASDRFVQDLQSMVGETVNFKVIEIDERRKRVIGSIRVILEAEKKELQEKFWSEAEAGKKYTGTVKSITSFGAFVDLGGVDGLVHISELSWSRIKHPSEVVKVGDVVDVYIKDMNKETGKISLGYKKVEDNPWTIAKERISIGDIIKVKIVRMMPFGAFAEIMPNVDGLIHISQIADKHIAKPDDVLSLGQEVDAMVTDVDWDAKKISLSIRALITPEVPEAPAGEGEGEGEAAPAKEEALIYSTDNEVAVEQSDEVDKVMETEEAPAAAEETPAAAEEAPAAEEKEATNETAEKEAE